MQKDIFEDAVKLMRCYFISDLRILKKEVYEMLYIVDFKQYDIPNLQQFLLMFLIERFQVMKI